MRRLGVMLAGTAVAMAFNPSVVGQYVQGALHDAPIWWHTPTLGGALRGLFGPEKFWLQFAPMLLGTGWLLAHGAAPEATGVGGMKCPCCWWSR